jgi:hypothetical protein
VIYRAAPFQHPSIEVINPFSEEALGTRANKALALGTMASQTWIANLAVFVPFGLSQPFLVREVWWANGSTAGANIDVGVYDTAGNRQFSLGTTAQGAASTVITSSTLTDVTLAAGDYFMAFASSGTTGVINGWIPSAVNAAAFGVGEMAAAFVLPNPATIVRLTNAVLPYFGLNGNTVAV